jgi:hypothetical protein
MHAVRRLIFPKPDELRLAVAFSLLRLALRGLAKFRPASLRGRRAQERGELTFQLFHSQQGWQ